MKFYRSNSNLVKLNSISNNDDGIVASFSSNNSIFLNNFINNTENACYGSINIWNSTKEITYYYGCSTHRGYLGNYWSDYNGTDSNLDGIGDAPYTVEENNVDYCPLVQRFENYLIQKSLQ